MSCQLALCISAVSVGKDGDRIFSIPMHVGVFRRIQRIGSTCHQPDRGRREVREKLQTQQRGKRSYTSPSRSGLQL